MEQKRRLLAQNPQRMGRAQFGVDDGFRILQIHTLRKRESRRKPHEKIETLTGAGTMVTHNLEDVTLALVQHGVGEKNPVVVPVE